jgi:2-C-methyl-D-erythritol 4-phosphate cytidylyltransferase
VTEPEGSPHREPPGSATVILLAAGSGSRLGLGLSKAFVPLADRPLCWYSVRSVAASGIARAIVLVVPPLEMGRARALTAEWHADLGPAALVVVAGGGSRQESVREGLRVADLGRGAIVCHDAARPFASPDLFRRVVRTLGTRMGDHEPCDGVVPVIPSPDSVKRVSRGRVIDTIPRDQLGLAQTPQAFAGRPLAEAHARAADGPPATDDAMLLEAAGYVVAAVEGEVTNFKITTGEDLARAEWVAARGAEVLDASAKRAIP